MRRCFIKLFESQCVRFVYCWKSQAYGKSTIFAKLPTKAYIDTQTHISTQMNVHRWRTSTSSFRLSCFFLYFSFVRLPFGSIAAEIEAKAEVEGKVEGKEVRKRRRRRKKKIEKSDRHFEGNFWRLNMFEC